MRDTGIVVADGAGSHFAVQQLQPQQVDRRALDQKLLRHTDTLSAANMLCQFRSDRT
jgi:hypothetical protein